MLLPKKVKHRKWHKLRSAGLRPATTKLVLSFGEYGLKALTPSISKTTVPARTMAT